MTIAEDRIAPWQGSTAPTDEKSANPPREFIEGDNRSPNAADYGDDLVNIVDFYTRRRYIPEINSSLSANIDDMRTDIGEYVKMSSVNRTNMVPLDVVARGAAGIVGVLCIASLILGSISKFQMVHPFVAVVLLAGSIFFYGSTTFKPKK
jgi:hypothetical protein